MDVDKLTASGAKLSGITSSQKDEIPSVLMKSWGDRQVQMATGNTPFEPLLFERPTYERWNKTKLALGTLLLISSIVILVIATTIQRLNSPYSRGESTWNPTELILGLSGTPALLAMLMTLIDYSVMWRSKLRKAANPGVGIAIHLLTWFIDSFAIWIVSSYTDTWCDEEGCIYHYPIKNTHKLGARSILYLKVLLAFDCLLGAISFILFVGCCVETHLVNKAKDRHRKTPLLVYVPCSDSGFVQGPNFWQVKSAVDNGPIRLQPALIYGWGIMKEASNSAQQKGSQQAIPGVLYGYPEPVAPPALKGNNAL